MLSNKPMQANDTHVIVSNSVVQKVKYLPATVTKVRIL